MIKIPGYTLHDQIGVGGMATVYRATQNSLQREVALKVVSKLDNLEPNFRKRFINEGHDLASLRHPNIATIYDISQTPTHSYYAMELLDGGSLTDRMERGISVEDSFNIIIQIGYALDYAHQQQIIHRDLKPGNILFRKDGTPILTDFGIAKNINRDTHLTQIGVLVGTPSYMSPEQCRGRAVDGHSDQYALSILFFEMITGYLPFDADDAITIATKQVTEPVPQLPDKFRSLQPIFNIALDKDPDERYSSMSEFCRVLEDALNFDLQLRLCLEDIVVREAERDTEVNPSFDLPEPEFEEPVDPHHTLTLPSEDEFWNERWSARKWLVGLFLLVCLGYGSFYFYSNYRQITESFISSTPRQVTELIQQTRQQMTLGKLTQPMGDNASESLSRLTQLDPENSEILQLTDRLVTSLVQQAKGLIDTEQYVVARSTVEQGLILSPTNSQLKLLQQEIKNQLSSETYQAMVKEKRNQAEKLLANGNLWKPSDKNAAKLLSEVLQINPDDNFARTKLVEIENNAANIIEKKLKADNLIAARQDAQLAVKALPASQRLSSLRKTINDTIHQKQTAKEIAAWLEKGRKSLQAGKIVEPLDNNAVWYFRKAYSLSADNLEVNQHLDQIANDFFQQALKLNSQKRPVSALEKVRAGLLARPNHRALNELKNQLESQLD